ncbi:MAG: hypothetical protein GXY83_00450, partial [Rhodopirellula sp.]|nr:hypothetical protein [Rhodopirellula sp.]
EYKLSTYLFAEVHAEAGEGHDVAMMKGSPGVDTLGASDTEVQLSGVNVFQKNFGYYAKNFDEIHANAGAGEDKAVLTDATVEADYAEPDGVDLKTLPQILWLNQFEKIEFWDSSTSSKTDDIDNIDQVFAWWE